MAKRRKKKKVVKATKGNPWPKILAEFRERHNLSQADAAELACVTRRAWVAWENGEQAPSRPYDCLLKLVIEKHDRKNP